MKKIFSLTTFFGAFVLFAAVNAVAQEPVAYRRGERTPPSVKRPTLVRLEELNADLTALKKKKKELRAHLSTLTPSASDYQATHDSLVEVEVKLQDAARDITRIGFPTAAAPAAKTTSEAAAIAALVATDDEPPPAEPPAEPQADTITATLASSGRDTAIITIDISRFFGDEVRVVSRAGTRTLSSDDYPIRGEYRRTNSFNVDVPISPTESTTVTVSSPDGTLTSTVNIPASVQAGAAVASTQRSAINKGGPLMLSVGGLVVSQQAQNFNQADPFFGFVAGYISDRREALGGWRWHLRFQGIFTSSGRAAEATNPTNPGNGDAGGAASDEDMFKYIASRKSFDFDTHAWIDFFDKAAFTIGPYGAWGASAVLDKNELQGEAVIVDDGRESQSTAEPVATQSRSDNDLKQFKELGLIMNLRGDNNKKLLLQAIVAKGWYEAFKDLDRDNDTRNRFIGKLRIFPMGLSIFGEDRPITPMLGIDLNAGTGPDHVKFFTGFSVQLKNLLKIQ